MLQDIDCKLAGGAVKKAMEQMPKRACRRLLTVDHRIVTEGTPLDFMFDIALALEYSQHGLNRVERGLALF